MTKVLKVSDYLKNIVNNLIDIKINNKIIDSSSSNYIKYTDGTLICFASTIVKNCPSGNTTYDITLPQNYKNDYIILTTKRGGGAYWANLDNKAYPLSNNSLRIDVWNNGSITAEGISFNILTIGTWK